MEYLLSLHTMLLHSVRRWEQTLFHELTQETQCTRAKCKQKYTCENTRGKLIPHGDALLKSVVCNTEAGKLQILVSPGSVRTEKRRILCVRI